MDIPSKQSWMSDEHWKSFTAILNSSIRDVTIDEDGTIVKRSKREDLTEAEIKELDDLKSKLAKDNT